MLAFRQEGPRVDSCCARIPFYAESGGQVSDVGEIVGDGWALEVDEVRKIPRGRSIGGIGRPRRSSPTPVRAAVERPAGTTPSGTTAATHLLHAALRKDLGTHVRQQGSLVAPDRLRFDFTHHGPVDAGTLAGDRGDVNRAGARQRRR